MISIWCNLVLPIKRGRDHIDRDSACNNRALAVCHDPRQILRDLTIDGRDS